MNIGNICEFNGESEHFFIGNCLSLTVCICGKTKHNIISFQESLFDEGLRIAQQYGMADFAEEIKGLIKHDSPVESTDDRSDVREINGNYKDDSNNCNSEDSQKSGENNHETEGTSSHEQNRLIENSSDIEDDVHATGHKTESNGIRVLNIVPLSESEEQNSDIEEGQSGVTCS